MKKISGYLLTCRMLFIVSCIACVGSGCTTSPQEDVVKTAYYHQYGPQIEQTDWQNLGSTGEVVEVLRNGVEVRKEYLGGVLHGTSSWTFPHMKIAERTEEYEHGQRVASSVNYETGSPKIEEQFFPDNRRVVYAWYEDGSPRYIEEYSGSTLIDGQYLTIDGDIESTVLAGTGCRIERSRSGGLLSREQISGSGVVATESYYSNGQLREAVSFMNGQRHGQSRRYLESGEPMSIEQWSNGQADGVQLFFEDGQPIRQISYSMGKKEGAELHFRPGTEEVVEEISWHNNLRHGPSKTYVADQVVTEWYWRGAHIPEEQFMARNSTNVIGTPS